MDSALNGKVILVSGGSSNLGAAICRAFSAEGAVVVCTWASETGRVKAEALVRELPACRCIPMDVCSEASVRDAFLSISETEGRLDVLINNSGVFTVSDQEFLAEADWDRVFDTNVKGIWRVCRHAIPLLKAARPSSIVNIASINAFHPGFGGTAHYDASKGAVVSYTKSLAQEVGGAGIRVNAIAPGLLDAQYLHAEGNALGPMYENRAVLGRMVRPADVASAAVFLASSLSGGIVGETIPVDCGYLLR